MERSEPSLVPEWLRSNGGGTGSGGSIHHFASSQADSPVSALPRRSTSFKNIGNTDTMHSSLLDRSISSNSRRSSNSNGFSKHDKNSYTRPCSSYSRSYRDRDRERSTVSETWNSDYSEPLRGIIGSRSGDPLRRSQSSNSRRIGELPQRRIPEDIRNGINKNHGNENGTHSSGGNVTGVQKVAFERDFPVLGSEERPRTPDITRISSPGLSRAIQSFSIVNPQPVGSEAWTSALVEVPSTLGSTSGQLVQPATTAMSYSSSSSSLPSPASTASGLKMAEALVQAPAQTLNTNQPSVQSHKDEFALAQSRKLIPMTPLSKTLVRSSSDTLKPRTPSRPSETTGTPKNGLHHLSPLQLGSQPARGVVVKGDGPKSPSGKLLVLKAGRENGVSHGLKDLQSPTGIINNRVANGHPTANQSVVPGPTKNPLNPKTLPGDRKTSGIGVDKRTSRSNFFKLMREKSLNNTSGTTVDSGASISSEVVEKSDIEAKELVGDQVNADHTGNELQCNGETCTVVDSLSPSMEIDYEKERALLFSLGWEDHGEDDDEGLTEEEIYAFYIEVMKQDPNSRLSLILQEKIFSHVGCFSSTEANTPASQTEA